MPGLASEIGVAHALLLMLSPFLGALVCLALGRRPGWAGAARWAAPVLAAALLVLCAGALFSEQAYVAIEIPFGLASEDGSPASSDVALTLGLIDWASVATAGAATLGLLFAFACSPCDPRRDAWLLLNYGLLCTASVAGNPVFLYLVLAATAGSHALLVVGARRPSWRHVLTGLAGLIGAIVSTLGLGQAIALSRADPGAILDLALFPATPLESAGPLVNLLLVGLAALAGLWPLGLRLSGEWHLLGPRAGSALLVVGPGAVALTIWLRLVVHARSVIMAGLALGELTPILLALAAATVAWNLLGLLAAYRPSDAWRALVRQLADTCARVGRCEPRHAIALTSASAAQASALREPCSVAVERAILGALAGLQVAYAILALLLASCGVGRGIYAFVASLVSLAVGPGGAALARRAGRADLADTARVVAWASLLGAPPLVGFFARFLLLRSAIDGLGAYGLFVLVPWIGEVVFVVVHVWTSGAPPKPTEQEPLAAAANGGEARTVARRGAGAAVWLALLLGIHLAGGPIALLLGDALARQMVPGLS